MVGPALKCAGTESSPACTAKCSATSTGPSYACQGGKYSGRGGLDSSLLSKLVTKLWEWSLPHFSSIRAVYVPGPTNLAAFCSPGEVRTYGSGDFIPEVVKHSGFVSRDAKANPFKSTHCHPFFSLLRTILHWAAML